MIGGEGQDPERLDAALAVQLLLAEEAREHVGPVDLRQIVLVNDVQRAEPGPHQPESRRGAERQGQQRGVGLVEADAQLARRRGALGRLLPGADPYHRARVGIDPAEELQLHLAREEPILAPGEGAVVPPLAGRRGEVRHEIPADADVEQQHATRLGEAERLSWAGQVGKRWRVGGRRGRGRRRYRRRRGRRGAPLELLETIAERFQALLVGRGGVRELLAQRLQLAPQGVGVLGVRGARQDAERQHDQERERTAFVRAHGILR